jgi:hypothetical protein
MFSLTHIGKYEDTNKSLNVYVADIQPLHETTLFSAHYSMTS